MNTLNLAHVGKYRVNFSNIPTLDKVSDLGLYEQFVKSVSFPDQSMELTWTGQQGIVYPQPVSRPNENLSELQINFKMCETWENYFNLFTYMSAVKKGIVSTKTLRENQIKTIAITLLDNNKRDRAIFSFQRCFLRNISSYNLEFGDASDIPFTCNFTYEDLLYEVKTI